MPGRVEMMAVVMAGGAGSRLWPLTEDRAKPAVPFGGAYRIIDFTLSNCFHSGLSHILLATQYRSDSLVRHIEDAWSIFIPGLGGFIHCSPPQQRGTDRWYAGTADSVYQNLFRIKGVRPERVIILAGDHIYKADYRKMLRFHEESGATVSVACLEVPVQKASRQFGVVVTDETDRIQRFEEKPEVPSPLPDRPETCLASMGIYIFDSTVLYELLEEGPGKDRAYDFGRDLLPQLVEDGAPLYAWHFEDENDKPEPYWKDVGTIQAYYEANMDLVQPEPVLNLYDPHWPVMCHRPFFLPPAKFVWAWRDDPSPRVGRAVDSLVCAGAIVSGGLVERSILAPSCRVNSYAVVSGSILYEDVDVGRHAVVHNAIVEKHIQIPEGARIGVDLDRDRERYHVTPEGVVVVRKETAVEPS